MEEKLKTFINKKVLGLIGISAKAGKVVSGNDATIDEIMRGKVKLVIVSEEASDRTKKNIKEVCDKNHIKFLVFGNIDELSKSIGKNNKAIIGIKSSNLSEEIEKLIIELRGSD